LNYKTYLLEEIYYCVKHIGLSYSDVMGMSVYERRNYLSLLLRVSEKNLEIVKEKHPELIKEALDENISKERRVELANIYVESMKLSDYEKAISLYGSVYFKNESRVTLEDFLDTKSQYFELVSFVSFVTGIPVRYIEAYYDEFYKTYEQLQDLFLENSKSDEFKNIVNTIIQDIKNKWRPEYTTDSYDDIPYSVVTKRDEIYKKEYEKYKNFRNIYSFDFVTFYEYIQKDDEKEVEEEPEEEIEETISVVKLPPKNKTLKTPVVPYYHDEPSGNIESIFYYHLYKFFNFTATDFENFPSDFMNKLSNIDNKNFSNRGKEALEALKKLKKKLLDVL